MPFDPYLALDVSPDADAKAVRAAWKRKAGQHHPDKNPEDPYAKTRFQLCKEAYEILSDPDRRQRYDSGGDASAVNMVAQAEALLVAVFQQTLEGGPDGIIGRMREELKTREKGFAKQVRSGRQANENLESVKEKFKFSGDGDNILEIALNGSIEHNVAELGRLEIRRDSAKLGLEMLENYDDVQLQFLFRDGGTSSTYSAL